MLTFIGILIGIGVVVLAISGVQAPYQTFINPHGALIVIGGILASTLISFRFPELVQGISAFFIVFVRGKHNLVKEINTIASLSTIFSRQGIAELEKEVNKLRPSLFKDGLTLFINGYKKEEIQKIIEESITLRWEREQIEVRLFRQMGRLSPAFGMVGTLVGMIFMLSQMREKPDQIGPFMAIALTATLYGLFLANAVFYPMAEKISVCADDNVILGRLWLEGIIMIIEKQHPVYIKDRLSSYLPPSERIKLYKEKTKKGEVTKPETVTK
jgi:chemotaxis protein MotA